MDVNEEFCENSIKKKVGGSGRGVVRGVGFGGEVRVDVNIEVNFL